MTKRTYQINTNRGVDLSSSPLSVAPSRASYMKNMISKGGINHKRNGWNEIASFEDADGKELCINGIFEYVHPETRDKSLIVYAGTQFFKCSYDFSTQNKITVEAGVTINGEKCKGYYKDGLLWLIGCGDFLVYDGESILRVENSEYTYAPVTSTNITIDGQLESLEDVNLLTNKRVNRLIGTSAESSAYKLDGKLDRSKNYKVSTELYVDNIGATDNALPYHVKVYGHITSQEAVTFSKFKNIFDSTDPDESVEYNATENITIEFTWPIYVSSIYFEYEEGQVPIVEFFNGEASQGRTWATNEDSTPDATTDALKEKRVTKMVVYASEDNVRFKKFSISGYKEYTGLITIVSEAKLNDGFYYLKNTVNTSIGWGDLYDNQGKKVNSNLGISPDKNYDRSEISFHFKTTPPISDEPNITVEYYADYPRSTTLTSSAVFTQANGVDLLLVANKDNAIFYTGLGSKDCQWSFGYLPAEKFITFGSDREPITAIVPMNDSVGVFKGRSFYRVAFSFNADSETYEAEYVPQITEATDATGCINQFVACSVNGDTLMFNESGVFGIEYSANQRSLKLRSSNVNKAFERYRVEELESAIACEHEGRYYLFIAGDVYIADSRFKVYESNRLDTSFEYEWWVWDNCPASVAYSIDGKLYFGKKNGKIAVFDDKYSDRKMLIAKVSSGEMSCTNNDNDDYTGFVFNEALEVKDGDKVTLKNCYRLLATLKISPPNEGVKEKDGLYKFWRKIVKNKNGELEGEFKGIYIGMKLYLGALEYPGKVVDYDAFDNGFTVKAEGYSATDGTMNIYADVTGIPYTVTEREDANGETELVLTSEGQAIELYNYGEIEATILREAPVKCEYHTPVLDLGSNLSLKTLNQLAITVSKETEGTVLLGYQSNNNNAFAKRQVGSALDFGRFDFNSLVFDGSFYKTHIKRVFERNFNYILFKLASESNSDFAIESFSLVYSSNNKLLKGDR